MAFRKTSSVLDYVSSTSPPKPFKGRPRTMSIQVPTGTTDILGNDHGEYKILKKIFFFNLCALKTSTVTSKFVKILCWKSIKFTLSTEISMTFVKYWVFMSLVAHRFGHVEFQIYFNIFLQAGAVVNIKTSIQNSTRTIVLCWDSWVD